MFRRVLGTVVVLFAVSAVAQQYDFLVRNGRVVDGSGSASSYADIGIIADRIVLVGHAPADATARRVIDAAGLIVAPGFIDMLGQSEVNLLIDRRAVSKLTQGITTEITGEGESIAPQSEATAEQLGAALARHGINVDWRDLDGYFRKLQEQGSGINLGT